ncbi:CARDB domain-containing protein [Natronoarchaeum rubrum]|uniref:CARDB domain-containing protein n=1 Tax=Natronoarchaeum rubrum TaxID=755311 RepID=UPI002110EDCF|nr:CARDB domain-containing protein [Natronoarchaeum rubrum]
MNRISIVLVVLAALFLAVPTMAATMDEDRAGDLSLSPGDSNGGYADIDADGQLSVEMDRLNDRATTTANDVFTITNTDDEDARVWVEHDLEGTTIYRGDPSNPVESRSAAFDLDAGETASLGVRADTRDADVEPGDLTIRAEGDDGPDFAVTDVEIEGLDANGSIAVGESIRITATVANRGTEGGTHSADLLVDGVEVSQRAVYVPAGERRTVTFERTFKRPGEYEVGVDRTPGGTVTVREPPAGDAAFEVRDPSLASASIAPGETVDVTATIENTGGSTGEFTAELAVGGTVLETRTVRLGPGETTTITFTRTFDRPGRYEIAISGASAGELDVSSSGGGGVEAVEQQLRSPATGVVGLSFVAGALLVSRRNPRELLALLR